MKLEKLFVKYGNRVHLVNGSWTSEKFSAFIQPIRYKTKLYVTGARTPIGVNHNDVYLYIGPASHDATKFDKPVRIVDSNNDIYLVDRAERVCINDKLVYIWAIIRKTKEGDI